MILYICKVQKVKYKKVSKKMSKKEKFVKAVQEALFDKVDLTEMDPDVVAYWEAFKGKEEADKPMFTDNGKIILKYLQDNPDITSAKAKDIGEGLFISSRAVSGAIRKLVNDGFVEKIGQDPVLYSITEKGKTIEIA